MSSPVPSLLERVAGFRVYIVALCGLTAIFPWLSGGPWQKLLPSFRALHFLPLFGSAFAAGWLVGFLRPRTGQDAEKGAIQSQASIAGLLTALVACFAAHATPGSRLPLEMAAAFTGLGLLPCALLANLGASFAYRYRDRRAASLPSATRKQVLALVTGAVLPAMGILVWPAVYALGKFVDKPPIAATPLLAPAGVPPPKPRYVKPEGFEAAYAWKRVVSHEDVIPNTLPRSAIALSHDEQRLAFVTRETGRLQLLVRHLYSSGSDHSLTLDSGITAMAWSPDDKRIIFLSAGSGVLWVCDCENGNRIRLPVPVFEGGQPAGLVWWRDESVLVCWSRDEPAILSLDTLRVSPANENADWSVLTEQERTMIFQRAFQPEMGRTTTAKFSFIEGIGDTKRTLAINDDESLYARFVGSAERNFTSAFPNRDGTMFFIMEPERLRILYMGLRQSPSLRFTAESKVSFPGTPGARAALKRRSVRAAVASPIVNPLSGKTVAGDPKTIKGYARFITANDKTCSVWIEQERRPVQVGDVLMNLSAIQEGEEFSVSPEWWAVLQSEDDVQTLPRREDVAVLTPSESRVLALLPGPEAPPPGTAEDVLTPLQPAPHAAPPPKTTTASQPIVILPDAGAKSPPSQLTDQEKIRQFIIEHSRKDIDGALKDYADSVEVGTGKPVSRTEIGELLRRNRQGTISYTETPSTSIEVNLETGNCYGVSYCARVESRGQTTPRRVGETLYNLEVLMTKEGPKIVMRRAHVLRTQPAPGRK